MITMLISITIGFIVVFIAGCFFIITFINWHDFNYYYG